MPDMDKVIEGLNEIMEFFRDSRANVTFGSDQENHLWEMQNTASDALALLKEQEPVKPIPAKPNELPRCGNCDTMLMRSVTTYCPNCGKKVAWDA